MWFIISITDFVLSIYIYNTVVILYLDIVGVGEVRTWLSIIGHVCVASSRENSSIISWKPLHDDDVRLACELLISLVLSHACESDLWCEWEWSVMWVCVCVREREREMCVCVYVSEWVSVCVHVHYITIATRPRFKFRRAKWHHLLVCIVHTVPTRLLCEMKYHLSTWLQFYYQWDTCGSQC